MDGSLPRSVEGGLSPRDFRRLAEFIHAYAGLKMPSSKKSMVEGRLRRRVRDLGFADFGAYCDWLFEAGGLGDETVHLIDLVTTNKTEFFREREHFNVLVRTALPARLGPAGGTFKVWSAACSTGAEPYTLAMVLDDFVRSHPRTEYAVLATDLCTEVLEVAKTAIYSADALGPVPADMRRRYFLQPKDPSRHQVRVVPELRRRVRFGRLNLMDEAYAVEGGFDAVFCRNVLIYFEKDAQEAVLQRLCDHLAPGGYLFIGHSESIGGFSLPVRPVAPTVFMKD
ncbi:MAG: CheR family methyltransferase [Actinomycetota bacterium]